MDDGIKRLRARLARMQRGRGKRYTPELKQQIAVAARQLRRSGLGWHRIGEGLGIPNETIRRFCGVSGGAGSGGFVPVVVADESAGAPVVVTPSGIRVEGLDFEQVALLLIRLGR
jgi:hypothetical protein